jgi:ATP synthase protein I
MARRDVPPSLKDLQGRLESARSRHREQRGEGGQGKSPVSGSGLGFGLRLAVDLLAGLAIGVGLGLVLDNWLNTAPLMLVVFFFLGSAAGMLNVYRVATGRGFAVGYGKRTAGDAEPEEARQVDAGSGKNAPRNDKAADEDRGGKS